MKRADIIATLGPSTQTNDVIGALIDAGATMFRLNFSWGTHENMAALIQMVRQEASRRGLTVPIIQDLSGPRMVLAHGHKLDEEQDVVITEKDLHDLDFGSGYGLEYVAMSYVGDASHIHTLRNEMLARGVLSKVIAKIERREALEHLEEIVESSDAIMIARGDLGLAFPIEEVAVLERRILDTCKAHGKYVIVATEMLLSMTEKETPTRAEVSDVTTAVYLGADALMLSEESARGEHPVEAVRMMRKIIAFSEDEKDLPHKEF